MKNNTSTTSTTSYLSIAGTSKYGLAIINNVPRVENYKGMYKKEVPYIEIPTALLEELKDYLLKYKDLDLTKSEGIYEFNKYCDNMFDEEHTELYPESVL